MKHTCPERCHRCPDMNGEVMPGCMGTAALALSAHDMSRCNCSYKLAEKNEVQLLKARLRKLEAKISRVAHP